MTEQLLCNKALEDTIQETLGVKPEVYNALQKLRRALEHSRTNNNVSENGYKSTVTNENQLRKPSQVANKNNTSSTVKNPPLTRIYTKDVRNVSKAPTRDCEEPSESVSCSGFCMKTSIPRTNKSLQTQAKNKRSIKKSIEPETHTTNRLKHTKRKIVWDTDTLLKMETCLNHIEHYGLEIIGIFGVSGSSTEIEQIHSLSSEADIPASIDIHAVTGFIKTVLREATQPLIPRQAFDAWSTMAAQRPVFSRPIPADSVIPNSKQAPGETYKSTEDNTLSYNDIWFSLGIPETSSFLKTDLASVLSFIPDFARAFVLAKLVLTLGRISAFSDRNKMNAHNLALVLAPAMTQWDATAVTALIELGKMTSLVEAMIKDAKENDQALKRWFEEAKRYSTSL
eukprot:jgi/Galph1/2146/GphlegSOOS_G775.1